MFTDDFLRDLSYSILIEYLRYYLPYQYQFIKSEEKIIFRLIPNDMRYDIILWKNKIIEFYIGNQQNSRYYLHFEFIDFYHFLTLLDDFFNYAHIHHKKNYRILICCSGGLTSSYFVSKIHDYALFHQEQFHIEAMSYTQIPHHHDYDLILLAPQLSYIASQIALSHQVSVIPTTIYATYDYKRMRDYIRSELIKRNLL